MGQKRATKSAKPNPIKGNKPLTGKDDPRWRPGPGRTPDEWKAMCREAVSRADRFAKALEVLDDPQHPAWLGALKFLAEHGFGKPNQTIETTVTERRVIVENGPNLSK